MKGFFLVLLVSVALARISSPIIGVLGLPASTCDTKRRLASAEDSDKSCFAGYYAEWLYQGGARVVPLRYNASDEEIAFFAQRLNGVLFTGGGLNLSLGSTYVKTALKWLSVATDPNKSSDPLAMWGTCQGFQLLHIMVARNESVLCNNCYDAEDISWPLNFTKSAASSRMYGPLRHSQAFGDLATQDITMNFHHDGIEPSTYEHNAKLSAFFSVLSTNVDRKSRPFISSVEAFKWPIFATQYHPERQAFEFSNSPNDAGLNHTFAAVHANNYLGQVFVERCRQSKRSFDSFDQAQKYLLYNWTPQWEGESLMQYIY